MPLTNSGANKHNSDKFGGNTCAGQEAERMPAGEREDVVLQFLADHGIALPPRAIYRGLKVERGITFSYRTVQNILKRLLDGGYVIRCDKESLDEGEIKPLPDDASDRRTYYAITESGVNRIGG